MKPIITICVAILMTASVFLPQQAGAQSPEKMSYQAVVRDASNALVSNTAIEMQISILQGSSNGTAVYIETQTPTSNANGLVSIEIGAGTVLSGDFTVIDWANGPYFLKTEIDPEGGTNYSITGTSQLLSVPYALHAKTADSVTGTITESDPIFGASVASGISGTDTTYWNNKLDSYTESDPIFGASVASGISGTDTTKWSNKQDQLIAGTNIIIIGDTISATGGSPTYTTGLSTEQGGYIFYVTPDGKHGLVAATQDQSTLSNWYNAQDLISNPNNHDTSGQKYTDWRMPTKYELNEMYLQKVAIGGFANNYYWSSSEAGINFAWRQSFSSGGQNSYSKNFTYYIRAVRAF